MTTGVVCPRGSAVATSVAALLEVCEDPAPELQCWDVAMCLLTCLYLKEKQRQLSWAPSGTQLHWYFHNSVSDEKKQMVANVEKQLEEARELLEQMELEVREIPPQSRGMYSSRMRSYKQEMGKLEADFKRSRIAYSDEVRNELLGDDGNSSENQLIKLREERAHLLDNTERLERSSRRLEAGYQIAVETEQIGQEMLENLSHDREKIQRARERLRETDANLGKSSRILTGMLRRIIQNRILIVVLAVIIIFTTMMAIYFSVRGR
ncbi:vesicle transport through interaction with t-SNAREs homolog 1A [Cyanistes caeruleus]|uniref:vesicle transport through interaction with t-SNAREs homolog 1A n=1 Tax=Cyanistes caeruleus TaxID=156563 RepID=UPI000CDA96A9|nr:vesicle transport through interaction with t-SNAREs homolog 1A [Cyanistes caeruleus]